jgi:putative colanic acid biosynthesis acetyltransferase WcaF
MRIAKRTIVELLLNRLLTHVPFNPLRIRMLRLLGADLGDHVYLFGGSEFLAPQNLRIDRHCHIGRSCQIDARGGIRIGRNVVIASHTILVTADHDIQDPGFVGRLGAITIHDRAWLASRVTVCKGVTIGEGAVAAAGAVVTEDVAPWTVVGGVPARPIGRRSPHQTYEIDYGPTWY